MELSYALIAFALLFFLSFANGSNDVSKAVATLAGAQVTSVRMAVLWGTVWTAVGVLAGLYWGGDLIRNMTHSLYQIPAASTDFGLPLAVALSSIFWVLISTWRGWPVSTTHAIVGGLIGGGVVALGAANISWMTAVHKIILPLLFSPFIAIAFAWLLSPALQKWGARMHGFKICVPGFPKRAVARSGSTLRSSMPLEDCAVCDCDSPQANATPGIVISIDGLHWLTSGLLSFSRGLNDAPKLIAVALPFILTNSETMKVSMFLVSTVAMAAGGLIAGRKITEILGFKVTKMNHEQGFSANFISTILVMGASRLGMPVSTTHVSASSIMGVGISAKSGVNRQVIASIVFAWLVTVPSTAIMAAVIYKLVAI